MEPQASVPASILKNIIPSSAETITEDANHQSAGVPVKVDGEAGVQPLVAAVANTEVTPRTEAKVET